MSDNKRAKVAKKIKFLYFRQTRLTKCISFWDKKTTQIALVSVSGNEGLTNFIKKYLSTTFINKHEFHKQNLFVYIHKNVLIHCKNF